MAFGLGGVEVRGELHDLAHGLARSRVDADVIALRLLRADRQTTGGRVP
jgi:NADH dehydrogenase FAD-containing subunit